MAASQNSTCARPNLAATPTQPDPTTHSTCARTRSTSPISLCRLVCYGVGAKAQYKSIYESASSAKVLSAGMEFLTRPRIGFGFFIEVAYPLRLPPIRRRRLALTNSAIASPKAMPP
jgi:hypothetical protein